MNKVFLGKLYRTFYVFSFYVFSFSTALAYVDEPETKAKGIVGGIGSSVGVAGGVVDFITVITGMALLFAGFLQFLNYRRNALEYPFSRAIILLLTGLLLLGVTIIPQFTGPGLPTVEEREPDHVIVHIPLPPTHPIQKRMNKPFFEPPTENDDLF
jgi:hypothetical protein